MFNEFKHYTIIDDIKHFQNFIQSIFCKWGNMNCILLQFTTKKQLEWQYSCSVTSHAHSKLNQPFIMLSCLIQYTHYFAEVTCTMVWHCAKMSHSMCWPHCLHIVWDQWCPPALCMVMMSVRPWWCWHITPRHPV